MLSAVKTSKPDTGKYIPCMPIYTKVKVYKANLRCGQDNSNQVGRLAERIWRLVMLYLLISAELT